MGIPVYFKRCIENYDDICIPIKNINKDNLFFDLNCLIHPCCSNETNENIMYEKIFNKLKHIIEIVKPKKMIFIAIDGPCPKPKIIQQRIRRYKSSKENKIWDTNAITPGTKFMNNLENYLLKKISYLNNFGKKIIFSSSNEFGEGEHKIFNYIKKNNIKSNIVYGLDSDLIMLSLIHDSKIYLLRETTEYNIENIDSEYLYLNIYNLKLQIIKNININNLNIDNDNLILDYIFICFFIGNDFIYNTPSINIRYNGLDELLNIYTNIFVKYNGLKYIVNNNKNNIINNDFLKEFLLNLYNNEDNRIKNIINIRNKQQHKYIKMLKYDSTIINNHKPIIKRNAEKFIFSDINIWREKYYLYTIFNIKYNEKTYPIYETILKYKIDNMCKEYINSLIWTLHYYLFECISWRFSYNYYYAPSIKNIYEYILNYDTIDINYDNNPYTPLEQLNIVLPNKSKHLIPDLINIETDIKNDNYKELTLLKRYNWECNINLPKLLNV